MAKAELYQIEQTTLFKDFCNNTSVFLKQHFSISTTSFRIFATCFICTEAQRNSFDPKKRYVNWCNQSIDYVLIFHYKQTDTFPSLAGSFNWCKQSIDYVLIFRYRQTNRHFFVTNRGFQLTF